SWLVDYIKTHADFIKPESRRNEVLGFLELPLEDLCITRPKSRLNWGIPYPTSDAHVVYVWFDALVNYVSVAEFASVKKQFPKIWPADVHMIGKDILRQHAVYWPIMLKAIGVEQPKKVLAHGWWTIEGAKVSKSRGNVVDPFEMVQKFSSDGVRYYLLSEVVLGMDGIYSEDLMIERFNTDLANDLGNLASRSTAMLERYFGGVLSKEGKPDQESIVLKGLAIQLENRVEAAMSAYDPRSALLAIRYVVTEANRFIERKKPWTLAKENRKEELGTTLYTLMETLRILGIVLQPFLPTSAKKILKCFGIETKVLLKEASHWGVLRAGLSVQKSEILFPKLETKP
ncbi:MAG: class I tRNA ligase family protein, partial [Candidatus Omnitrophica bacterium]|nr:class I tRNA ligase family protein [Candidatus Omnitrophota bacterium]